MYIIYIQGYDYQRLQYVTNKLLDIDEDNDIFSQHIDLINSLIHITTIIENGEYKFEKINYHEIVKVFYKYLESMVYIKRNIKTSDN